MTQHQHSRTILIACMLIAFAGYARADIMECIDETGSVTFTDAPCKADADSARAPGSDDTSPARRKAWSQAGDFAAAEQARATAWASKPKPKRALALDVATLKTARDSMTSNDQASALVRRLALAQRKAKAPPASIFSLVGSL